MSARAIRLALLAIAVIGAVAWPLLTYSVTLAAFGAIHVLCELRYIDLRFGARVERRVRVGLLVGVAAIAAGRLVQQTGLVQPAVVELVLGAGLVALVLPTLARAGRLMRGLVIAGLLITGAAVAPAHALLAIAVLHNLTPVGFVAEATAGAARRRALAVAALVFAVVPLLIATGVPYMALAGIGLPAPEFGVLPTGPLAGHFRAYLPAAVFDESWSLHAFSACVYLQCAHYIYVIDVLPRGLPPAARGLAPWPVGRIALAALIGVALIGVVAFSHDFVDARARYGALAAVHAWLEVPVLLLVLLPVGVTRPAAG